MALAALTACAAPSPSLEQRALLDVIEHRERQLHDRRDDLLVAETARATATIRLYVALGGGWDS